MDLQSPFTPDNRGVSAVIGVVLLVGLTVLLASAVSVIIFGFSDDLEDETPNMTPSFVFESNEVAIDHNGGENIQEGEVVRIVVDTSTSGISASDVSWGPNLNQIDPYTAEVTGDIETGDRIAVIQSVASTDYNSGDQVRLAWSSQDVDSSSVVGTFSFP